MGVFADVGRTPGEHRSWMIRRAWQSDVNMPPGKSAALRIPHSALMEPGTGRFHRRTDGPIRQCGARPQRPCALAVIPDHDDKVIMASEVERSAASQTGKRQLGRLHRANVLVDFFAGPPSFPTKN